MRITTILLLMLMMMGVSSCDKKPINGKLDGRWQLMSIEGKDGQTTACNRIYYSIQLHLIEISDKSDKPKTFIGRFSNGGDEITVGDFRRRYNEEQHATLEELAVFGLYQLDTRFKVEQVSRKHLTLRSDDACLNFRKF